MSDYVLRGGDAGAARLRLLAQVKWPSTRALLKKVGLRAGWRCLDVGCGSGAVTLKMARWVGAEGRAMGVDSDDRCLDLARGEAKRRRLGAEFRASRADQLDLVAGFDLVYARFLLTHLAKPEAALTRMQNAARPGGLVVIEDIDFTGHYCYPACPAFQRYVELYREVVRRKGGDADIGPRLLSMMLDAGLEDVRLRVLLPTYRDGPGKRMAEVTLEHIREAVVGAGLATNAEVDQLVDELRLFADDPRTLLSLPRIFQLWGRRPVSPGDRPHD